MCVCWCVFVYLKMRRFLYHKCLRCSLPVHTNNDDSIIVLLSSDDDLTEEEEDLDLENATLEQIINDIPEREYPEHIWKSLYDLFTPRAKSKQGIRNNTFLNPAMNYQPNEGMKYIGKILYLMYFAWMNRMKSVHEEADEEAHEELKNLKPLLKALDSGETSGMDKTVEYFENYSEKKGFETLSMFMLHLFEQQKKMKQGSYERRFMGYLCEFIEIMVKYGDYSTKNKGMQEKLMDYMDLPLPRGYKRST